MKTKSILIVLLAILSLLLSACTESNPPKHVPFSQLSFVIEDNPNYIGSYNMSRTNHLNASWQEWGEWTPLDFSSRIICFGAFTSKDSGTFRARSDFEWIEVEKDGAYCLKLEKKD